MVVVLQEFILENCMKLINGEPILEVLKNTSTNPKIEIVLLFISILLVMRFRMRVRECVGIRVRLSVRVIVGVSVRLRLREGMRASVRASG